VTRFASFKSDPIGRAEVDAWLVDKRAARGARDNARDSAACRRRS